MSLVVVPCTAADFPHAVEVEHAAFKPNPFTPILFPGPFPDEALESRVQSIAKDAEENETTRWLKVVDSNDPSGKGLAYAQWNLWLNKPFVARPRTDFGEGCNIEACRLVFGHFAEQQKELIEGKNCIYLQILVTDPKQERRGAAGKLIAWGVEQGDKHGVPLYLESSPVAHELYKRHGFKDVAKHSVDLSQWGATELHEGWAMLRESS